MISANDNTYSKYIFVYNLIQAEFYFSKGITPLKVGKGTKGDVFVQFLRTDALKSAFDEWCNRWRPMV
jgi:hypothetical protein